MHVFKHHICTTICFCEKYFNGVGIVFILFCFKTIVVMCLAVHVIYVNVVYLWFMQIFCFPNCCQFFCTSEFSSSYFASVLY